MSQPGSPTPRALTSAEIEDAAVALADGLARRTPRVTAPARWRPVSALRGIVAPALDPRRARDQRIPAALSTLDARTTPTDTKVTMKGAI